MSPRSTAALALTALFRSGLVLKTLLPDYAEKLTYPRDKSLFQELCYGVLRWHPQLEFILSQLIEKNFRAKDTDIKELLLIGIYQLRFLHIPEHAAIAATVEGCRELNKSWATKVTNAVLRNYQRRHVLFEDMIKNDLQARYAHPNWFIYKMKSDFPQQWQSMLNANNQRPPMTLRINRKLISRSDYLDILNKNNVLASITEYSNVGLTLEKAVDVGELHGFENGMVSVQDQAAQLCMPLLDLKDGQRILDACAAPGGKLAHILEQPCEYKQVIAIEKDKVRFKKLEQTLERLQLTARLICQDLIRIDSWWDGKLFDRILLDAPCSASGVIRRNPDIKYSRKPEQIKNFSDTQADLLDSLWPLLKKGGRLVYATCSVFDEENNNQIRHFLKHHSDASITLIKEPWGMKTEFGRQILTGVDNMDGFFYASLQKS